MRKNSVKLNQGTHICGDEAEGYSALHLGDPCDKCQSWTKGYRDSSVFSRATARYGLVPLTGHLSPAALRWAEAWRVGALQAVETVSHFPAKKKLRRRIATLLKTRPYSNPRFWLDRNGEEWCWFLFDVVQRDNAAFLIYIADARLYSVWALAGPVQFAATQHSFTREELVPLTASPVEEVRALGLRLISVAGNRQSRQ